MKVFELAKELDIGAIDLVEKLVDDVAVAVRGNGLIENRRTLSTACTSTLVATQEPARTGPALQAHCSGVIFHSFTKRAGHVMKMMMSCQKRASY